MMAMGTICRLEWKHKITCLSLRNVFTKTRNKVISIAFIFGAKIVKKKCLLNPSNKNSFTFPSAYKILRFHSHFSFLSQNLTFQFFEKKIFQKVRFFPLFFPFYGFGALTDSSLIWFCCWFLKIAYFSPFLRFWRFHWEKLSHNLCMLTFDSHNLIISSVIFFCFIF